MQFSDQVMADQDSFCPALQAGATLVTVNQRLARHYQRRYDAWQIRNGASVWDTPSIVSWTSWLMHLHDNALCEGLSDYPLLSASLDERLWRIAVRQVDEGNNKDNSLLNQSAAAQQARSAWLIQHAWHCHVGEGSVLSKDQQVYGEWSKAFRQLCHQHKAIDQSRIATELRKLWPELSQHELLPQHVLFAGFLTPTMEQQAWWNGLPEFGVKIDRLQQDKNPANPQRYLFLDDMHEWKACASYARALLENNPNELIGIVIPELQSHRTDVLRAFDGVFFPGVNPDDIHNTGRPYDVSLGVSLAQQPVVQSALLMLRFLVEPVPTADITSILLSPYCLKAKSAAQTRQRCDRFFRDERCWELSANSLLANEKLANAVDSGLRDGLTKAVKTLDVKPQSFKQWSTLFGKVLQRQLGWPSTNLTSLEYQAAKVWQQIIDEFESLDDGETMPAIDALNELHRLCQQRLFQPETPNAPVQIMGRLESHGLAFDHLWITGCDSTQWPPKTTATTLLPRGLQQERGVPESSAAHRLSAAKLEWAHWCHLAPNVIASSVETRDGQMLPVAACIAQLPENDRDQLPGSHQFHNLVDVIATEATSLISVADTHGPAITEGMEVTGGARRLEDQAKCPFKGFVTHHLRVKSLEHPDMGLDPREHGTLLHLSLEAFWGEVKTSSGLHALSAEALDEKIIQAIEFAIEEEAVDAQLASLERPRLKRLIGDWLTLEKEREVAFTVESMEEKHPITDYGFEINVTVDRVDRLETGERIILDYKTGQYNRPADWALERIENPQLPLYSTVNQDLDGLSYAQVVQNDMAFKGVAREKGWLPGVSTSVRSSDAPEDWDEWRAHWQESLNLLAKEIREGVATITPRDKACEFCDLKPLCRYRASSQNTNEDEVNHGS